MKKVINTAIFAAIVAGSVVTAQAADIQVNMYGASAQRDYWQSLGETFLKDTDTSIGMGCASAHLAQVEYVNTSGVTTIDKNSIAIKGESCSANGGDDVYITYTAVASLEGIAAANNVAPVVASLQCDGTNPALRNIANVAKCDLTKTWPTAGKCANQADLSQYACADIQLGTSDVEGESFTQISNGNQKGHISGPIEAIDLTSTEYDAAKETSNLDSYKPTVVPFAFYTNNKVGGALPSGDQANLSRTQAVNLFAGKVKTWNQLKGYEAITRKVVLCLRHAGSGTHATLDTVVFRGDNLDIIQDENAFLPATNVAPYAYFYQSSSDLYTCVATNAGKGNTFANLQYGAVGYADADAVIADAHQMKYQGVPAIDKANIAAGKNDYINKGSYDFWSAQNVYLQNADNTPFVAKMMDFAENNIPEAKYGIWTKKSALLVDKALDTNIPVMKP
jgi:hypothetical protein